MPTATIYKIKNKDYLLFGEVKTVSGFRVGTDPYIRIIEEEAKANNLIQAFKKILNNDDNKRIADPKNWSEHNKEFLQKTGLKSLKELNKPTTMCCGIERKDDNIIFTPTKHAEKPDEGFLDKIKEAIMLPYTASDQEIVAALELAFSKCE